MSLFRKITPSIRINALLLFTVLAIAGGFSYYFFVHIPANEQRLVKRNFRMLDRFSENLELKQRTTGRFLYNNLKEIINGLPVGQRTPGQVDAELKRREGNSGMTVHAVEELTVWDKSWESRYELSFYSYFAHEHIQFSIYLSVGGLPYRVHVFASLEDYLRQPLANLNFEDFMLVKGDKVVYKSFSGGVTLNVDGRTDSLNSFRHSLYTHKRFPAEIGGEGKWLFVVPGNLFKEGLPAESKATESATFYIGVVDGAEFQREKLNFSALTIVLLIFLTTGLGLSLPYLKLQLLSAREQLNRSDAVLAGLCLILGCALVTLGLLNAYSYLGPEKTRTETELRELAKSISGNFNQAIKEAITTIKSSTKLLAGDLEAVPQTNFNHLYWMDAAGVQQFKWSTLAVNSPKIDVSKRDYFREVVSGRHLQMPFDSARSEPFYFQTVLSWNSGQAEGVVSVPLDTVVRGKRLAAAAMSFPMASIGDHVLPRGYSFAVLDRRGNTIFHTEKRRILQENFLEESGSNRKLAALLNMRGSGFIELKYGGDSYKAYILPLQNTPYIVVSLLESRYVRSANTQVLIYTFWLLLSLALFNLTLFILYFLSALRSSRLKAADFSYHWLRPVRGYSSRYFEIIVVYLVIIAGLLLIPSLEKPFMNSFVFLLGSVYAFLVGNIKAKGLKWREFIKDDSGRRTLLVPASFILLLNGLAFLVGEGVFQLIAFQLAVILAVGISEQIGGRVRLKTSYQYLYSGFVWLWLMIISILPTLKVYEYTFTEEQKLFLKYQQMHLAEQYAASPSPVNLSKFFHKTHVGFEASGQELALPMAESDSRVWMNRILSVVRPLFDEYGISGSQLAEAELIGISGRWTDAGDRLQLNVVSPEKKVVKVISQFGEYSLPALHKNGVLNPEAWIFWAAFICLGIILYITILHLARKIFLLQTLGQQPLSREQIRNLVMDTGHPFILLVGLPGSGKRTFLEGICQALQKQAAVVRVAEIVSAEASQLKLQALAGKTAVFVVDELEYDLAAADQKVQTLGFLEKLLLLNPDKIVVSSAISPLKYLESSSGEANADSVLQRWAAVFGRFYQVYFPLPALEESAVEGPVYKALYEECRYGHFLHQLYPSLRQWVASNEEKWKTEQQNFQEDIVLQVQSLCDLYYKSLWRQCTTGERYVLFDLAQDNLVNPRNVKIIKELLARGLVVSDGGVLKLMNRSFRNFVLTSISEAETREIEDFSQRAGNWSRLRMPLLVLLFTLSLFVFITQRGTFNAVIGAIPGFLAGLGVLHNLFQSLGTGKALQSDAPAA